MTVSAGLDSQLVTGRYLFKHSPQDGMDKVLAAYGEEERTVYPLFNKQTLPALYTFVNRLWLR